MNQTSSGAHNTTNIVLVTVNFLKSKKNSTDSKFQRDTKSKRSPLGDAGCSQREGPNDFPDLQVLKHSHQGSSAQESDEPRHRERQVSRRGDHWAPAWTLALRGPFPGWCDLRSHLNKIPHHYMSCTIKTHGKIMTQCKLNSFLNIFY